TTDINTSTDKFDRPSIAYPTSLEATFMTKRVIMMNNKKPHNSEKRLLIIFRIFSILLINCMVYPFPKTFNPWDPLMHHSRFASYLRRTVQHFQYREPLSLP